MKKIFRKKHFLCTFKSHHGSITENTNFLSGLGAELQNAPCENKKLNYSTIKRNFKIILGFCTPSGQHKSTGKNPKSLPSLEVKLCLGTHGKRKTEIGKRKTEKWRKEAKSGSSYEVRGAAKNYRINLMLLKVQFQPEI